MTKKKSKTGLKSETPKQDAFDAAWEKNSNRCSLNLNYSALEQFLKTLDRSFRSIH